MLPRPLSDPLRAARKIAMALTALGVLSGLITLRALPAGSPQWWFALALQGLGLGIGILLIVRLPSKACDALYLRAFHLDDSALSPRAVIEAVLHPRLRVGGIVAPRRRFPVILRLPLFGLLVLRYAFSRYLNLEAEEDWLARLWATLGETRVVFIDVREFTPSLEQEIRLVHACLGPERTIYVAGQGGESDARSKVAGVLSMTRHAVGLPFAVWDEQDIDSFAKRIAEALRAVPDGTVRPPPAALAAMPGSLAATRRVRVIRSIEWATGAVLAAAMSLPFWAFGEQEPVRRLAVTVFRSKPVFLASVAIDSWLLALFALAVVSLLRRDPYTRFLRSRSALLALKDRRRMPRTQLVLSGAIAAAVIGTYQVVQSRLEQAKIQLARAQLRSVANALELYRLDTGNYPAPERWSADLRAKAVVQESGRGLVDPWGEEIEYRLNLPERYSIVSKGPDRILGTDDDVRSGGL